MEFSDFASLLKEKAEKKTGVIYLNEYYDAFKKGIISL